jgi:hypothetical protein
LLIVSRTARAEQRKKSNPSGVLHVGLFRYSNSIFYLKKKKTKGYTIEKILSLRLLAQLCFDEEIANRVAVDVDFCNYLQDLIQQNRNKDLKRVAQIILWSTNGKKFLLRHFFGQVLNRKNPSFIRASLLSKECFISPRFCLLEFKITSNLEKYFCGFIHA